MQNSNRQKTKHDFKVIKGEEYEAFIKVRKSGARALIEVQSKISNIDGVIEILQSARTDLKKQTAKLEKALGLNGFLNYGKKNSNARA